MKNFLIVGALLLVTGGAVQAGVDFSLETDQAVYEAGKTNTIYLKIGVKGDRDSSTIRPHLNVSLVLDRSGSMEGEKLEQAKKAARYAVSLLNSQDVLSLVVYDTTVDVLVPAQPLRDPEVFYRAIDRIESRDSTALFAGVSQGAAEVKHYLEGNRVNRVILLSDGMANVGPDSPAALGDLGSTLRRQNISVTTIGLGNDYNEDLMARLAETSDGNHAFVENARDLTRIFNAEFKDVLSVAAVDVRIQLECAPGVIPKRILNRDGDIRGQTIQLNLNQVLSSQEKYILVECEAPAGVAGSKRSLATANVEFRDLKTQAVGKREAKAELGFSQDLKVVKDSGQKAVQEQVVLQLSTKANEEAVKLRDEGRVDDAKKLLQETAAGLKAKGAELNSAPLAAYGAQNAAEAEKLDQADWDTQRKSMKESQQLNKTQRSY